MPESLLKKLLSITGWSLFVGAFIFGSGGALAIWLAILGIFLVYVSTGFT